MSRYISNDIEELIEYIKTYSLSNQLQMPNFNTSLRTVHKKIFAYLVVISEIEFQNIETNNFTITSLAYLKESVSDLIQSLLVWSNGAYKSSDLLMRSSIETFLKAMIGNNDASIYVEKSVYKIFEMASNTTSFKAEQLNVAYHEILHNLYSQLCMTVHTATNNNMDHITALNMLPKYNRTRSDLYVSNICNLVNAYLGFMLSNNKSIIYKMHESNQEVFFEALSNKIKKDLFEKMVG